jgi:hypothetical protein
MSYFLLFSRSIATCGLNLGGNHRGRRINVRSGDALHVALLVNGLAVFIGTQIDPQVEQLASDYARYLWKRVPP